MLKKIIINGRKMIVNLNEKEYRVLKRVLREASKIDLDDYPGAKRPYSSLSDRQKKNKLENLLRFYGYGPYLTFFSLDKLKKLKYDISSFPSEAEIIEAYESHKEVNLYTKCYSTFLGHEVIIDTDIHPDGTYEVKLTYGNDTEYGDEWEKVFSDFNILRDHGPRTLAAAFFAHLTPDGKRIGEPKNLY